MRLLNKFLLSFALALKFLHVPHIIKYAYLLMLRGRDIKTLTKINNSNAIIEVNLGEFIQYWIFMDGTYEEDWIKYCMRLVPQKVLIDIGSNVGIYPLSLYPLAKKIYAFEPESNNYKQLLANLKSNNIKNVNVYKKAMSSANKKGINLYISEFNSGLHSLVIKNSSITQKVDTMTLDSFIKNEKVGKIALIKIDVEGVELEVLRGSEEVINKFHPSFLVEANRPRSEKSGYDLFDLFQYLFRKGYHAYRLRKKRLVRIGVKNINKIYNENILFRWSPKNQTKRSSRLV